MGVKFFSRKFDQNIPIHNFEQILRFSTLFSLNNFLKTLYLYFLASERCTRCLPLSLLRNDFQFNNKTYLQTQGTAMGKKYAPAFANIFMHYWEQKALSSTNYTPLFWKRYIDDIFGIWRHSEDHLHTFIQHLNSINPNIKVSITHNLHSTNFLDCNVYKNHSKLSTKAFSNQQTHKLLHPKSYHPAHVFKGILKRNYFAIFVYHHIFMISCNPTAFLNLIF